MAEPLPQLLYGSVAPIVNSGEEVGQFSGEERTG